MTTYDIIAGLCKKQNLAVTALERELGFGRGSIGKLRNGKTTFDRLQKIANYFDVPVEYLLNVEDFSSTENPLTSKDERDIAKTVNELMEKLDSNDGAPLFYDGEEMDEQTKLLFRNQLNSLVTTVKEINKVNYYELLKIPGIGPTSAKRIIKCRKKFKITFLDLKKMGVVLKRAKYFITCDNQYYFKRDNFNKNFIEKKLILEEKPQYEQMRLFE